MRKTYEKRIKTENINQRQSKLHK